MPMGWAHTRTESRSGFSSKGPTRNGESAIITGVRGVRNVRKSRNGTKCHVLWTLDKNPPTLFGVMQCTRNQKIPRPMIAGVLHKKKEAIQV